MIYVPDKENYACYVVQSEDIIRAYKNFPTYNTNVDFRDYYFNSNYLYRDGNQQFGSYSTLPICLDNSIITSDIYYRNDFDKILIIFIIITIIGIIIPLKIFSKLFKRGRL